MSSGIRFVRGLANSVAGLHPALLEARVFDALERNAAVLMAENRVPGLQFAMAVADRPLRDFCAGVGTVDANARASRAIEKRTHFRVASLSKPISAMVVLRAAAEGLVSLDAPIGHLLSGIDSLRDQKAEVERITLRLLLSHASGIADQNMPHVREGATSSTLEEALNGALGPEGVPRLERKPGEKTSYSGLNYALLELAMRRLTGRTFEDLAREYLLKPCGSGCSYSRDARVGIGIASEHDAEGRPLPHQVPVAVASSGLVGSAVGIVELLRDAVESSAGRQRGVLGRESAELLFTLQPVTSGVSKFALGFHRVRDSEPSLFDHHGHRPGLRCEVNVIPEARVTVVSLSNGDRGDAVSSPVLSMIRAICSRRVP